MKAYKAPEGSLGVTRSGYDHLPLVEHLSLDPKHRNDLLLLEFEGETPASTGPLPYGPSVYHSAVKCAAPANQPIGLAWVAALTAAVVQAHSQARRALPA